MLRITHRRRQAVPLLVAALGRVAFIPWHKDPNSLCATPPDPKAQPPGRRSSTPRPFRSKSRPTIENRPIAIGTGPSTTAARKATVVGARTDGASPGKSRLVRSPMRRRPAAGGEEAKHAVEAMLTMKKVDVAAIEAERRN